jgi:uncharacterized membrane protein
MPHAFSIIQLVVRICFLVLDIVINSWIVSHQQPFTIGTFTIGTDYGQSIILFNAAMIIIICIVDFLIVAVRRFSTNYHIGAGITDMYRHEH